jgi:hypothetical protein
MKNLNYFYKLFMHVKNSSDIPMLTQTLVSSHTFRKTCLKIHNAKGKLINILDNAAFPESRGKTDLKTTDHKDHHNHHGHHKK